MLDTLYLHYSGANLADLGTLPRHFLHICDTSASTPASRAGTTHIIRDGRLYLGEGCIDFYQIMDRLPHVPLSIELPNAEKVKELGYKGHARRCLETAKHYLQNSAVAV